MKRKLSTLCLILALGGVTVRAGDAKLDPTGTWKQTLPDTKTLETTFSFKLQGAALAF